MSFNYETNIDIEASLADIESLPPIGYDRVIHYIDAELARIKPAYNAIMEARHNLYDMVDSGLDSKTPIDEQLDPENSYNSQWTKPDLRLRKGGVEFHTEPEKLDDDPKDSEELSRRKKIYRQSIIKAAETLGGYLFPGAPGRSPDELDRHLGMRESTLSPEQPLVAEAAIVPAAAALSNHMRLRDTLRNIESGALQTNRIIITAGERAIPAAEKAKVEAKGYRSGDTEFEAVIRAFEDLTNTPLEDQPTKTLRATYGTNTPDTQYKTTQLTLGDTNVEVIVLEAGYDRERRHDETGRSIGRASTDETFYAALPFMKKDSDRIVIESHDAWIPYQDVIGNQVFGLYADKEVVSIGPFKDDRIVLDENGEFDMTLAQGVVDEIGKRHDDLVKLRVLAENAKSPEIALLGRLVRPIPDMTGPLERKKDYREHPIKSPPEFENEPLVNAADYGIAGQSYYSRKNAVIEKGIPGVPKEIMLRKSYAETLAMLNKKLDNPIITAYFGGEVEMYIEEGIRNRATQTKVREEDYPAYLRQENPDITEEEILDIVNGQFAAPSKDGESPSPHEVGAFDARLRYKHADKGFVEDSLVPLGFDDGEHGPRIIPDFYEHNGGYTPDAVQARNFRRAYYNIMTGAAFNIHTGLVANPNEIFHWSRHDQLAAKVTGQPAALYGLPNTVQ